MVCFKNTDKNIAKFARSVLTSLVSSVGRAKWEAESAESAEASKRARKRAPDTARGFTMVEMVIIIFIITIISALVLSNFQGFGQNIAIQKSTQELALNFRKAQNMSLSVRQIETSSGPVIPPAVGLYFDVVSSPDRYFIFADLDLSRTYDSNRDAKIGGDIIFDNRVKINSITDQSSATQSIVNVVFSSPEATMTIYDQSNSIGDQALIELITVSGDQKKKIRVRTSGQISIE